MSKLLEDEPVRNSVTSRDNPTLTVRKSKRGLVPNRWSLFVVPAVIFIAVFFAYPVLAMFTKSFTDFPTPGESLWANYSWFVNSEVQRAIIVRTLVVGFSVTAICLVLGFPFAYLMTVVSLRWRFVMLAVVLMPFWTSMVVRTYSWVVLLQDSGIVRESFGALGIETPRLLGTTTAVIMGSTQVLLPFMILPLFTSLLKIDRSLLQAAGSLGAKPLTAFMKIYLPLAVPGILAGCTIVFILSLGFYFTPALLGSPQNSLVAQQIVDQVSKLLAFGRGGTIALVLLVVAVLLLGIGAITSRRIAPSQDRRGANE
ncbi:ABC transporter permease [Arthrobacter sp. 2MCAF15]|uniref:ABC transporter permease n=1 Tax=Arthrobacter sp. 2MCAF15 TaxID=3232984 RepID=UPI003F8EAC8C